MTYINGIHVVSALLITVLASCGGGADSGMAGSGGTATFSSTLNDAPVKGVCYMSQPSGLHGVTDASGSYSFKSGDSVSYWINLDGTGCNSTLPTSTNGVSLGAASPNGNAHQTFILSLSEGAQVAETLQALNHGSVSSMDVGGETIADTTKVSSLNAYISSNGASQATSSAIVTLFQGVQGAATFGGNPITPALPVASTFQLDVVTALISTASTGLGTAPTTVTYPANRLNFNVTSGSFVRSGCTVSANNNPTPSYSTSGGISWFDGAGSGIRIRPMLPNVGTNTPNISTYAPTALEGPREQVAFTYTASGNTLNKISPSIYQQGGVSPISIASSTDVSAVQYDDGHGAVYSGTSTKTYNNSAPNVSNNRDGCTDTDTFTGADLRLTPLTLAMLANRVVTIAAPGCTNGTATLTFNSTGTASSSTCSSGQPTWAASANVPGILIRTFPTASAGDGSILYVGLDGPSVAAGSALVFVTENDGSGGGSNYPNWGRLQITAVQ